MCVMMVGILNELSEVGGIIAGILGSLKLDKINESKDGKLEGIEIGGVNSVKVGILVIIEPGEVDGSKADGVNGVDGSYNIEHEGFSIDGYSRIDWYILSELIYRKSD